jgi:hypothetical protein
MPISRPSRTTLKSFFIKKAIPTESQFADLIDGMLHQQDDGLVKTENNPLAIQALGTQNVKKKVLALYFSAEEETADWTINLQPSASSDPSSVKRGLNIAGIDDASRLFIERGTGNIGVGNVEPAAKLHVSGAVRIDGDLKLPAPLWRPIALASTQFTLDPEVQPPSSYKDPRGIVRLRGFIKGPPAVATAVNTTVGQLEAGFRPAVVVKLLVASPQVGTGLTNMHYYPIEVRPNGDLVAPIAIGIGRYLYLDGLTFEVAP